MESDKPKLAMYWAASCGGCEVALANIHEVLLEVDGHFDFMFCPCFLDTKKKDLEALPDGSIHLTLFNGALRTEENLEMALLLRRKSRIFVAFGSCAASGGIPALANERGIAALLDAVYRDSPGLDNPGGTYPCASHPVPGGELELPAFLHRVLSLPQAVPVEYLMPGCPPEPEQIVAVLRLVASGGALPPQGGLLGCSARAVCEECARERRGRLAPALVRPHQALPEAGWCLVEQGFACLGGATRGGCQALCPAVAMPCTGCYGPLERAGDPGGAALSALAAALSPGGPAGEGEAELLARYRKALSGVADPLGTFYRYTLSDTLVAGRPGEDHP
jgi:F420-non-reducing hydrogenase small subunit